MMVSTLKATFLQGTGAVFRRELAAYFTSAVAGVVLIAFLVLATTLTFYVGRLLERGQADLAPFFQFHPWLYLFFVPAIGMRLWAEDKKSGVIEVLTTLPVSTVAIVLGKWLAAWVFLSVALVLTLPLAVTVAWLGDPDSGVMAVGYLASWLMGGAFMAVTAAISASTRNQVVAFVGAAAACFILMFSGMELVLAFFSGWAGSGVSTTLGQLSALSHFADMAEGMISVSALVYFATLMATAVASNVVLVDWLRGR